MNLNSSNTFSFYDNQAIIKFNKECCKSREDILSSSLLSEVISRFLNTLRKKESYLLKVFPQKSLTQEEQLLDLLKVFAHKTRDEIEKNNPEFVSFFKDTYLLHQIIEKLYDFWRNFTRFLVCYSTAITDKKPYRTFNKTAELVNILVRTIYRDICENITGIHPRIYRQVAAGYQIGLIVSLTEKILPIQYSKLKNIQVIRQILLTSPLIIDPPANKRDGQFRIAASNPIYDLNLDTSDWLCYPAKVGHIIIYAYFHNKFIGLGTALANLFDLAEEKDLTRKPDAICVFGAPESSLEKFGHLPTVFYDDKENDLLFGVIPDADHFGYFGYLKKMMLTLHNIKMMQCGRLPVHGAMICITLKNDEQINVIIMGDTGAGKSESIEAFRFLKNENIKHMKIIFDDMGSLELDKNGAIKAYGTETGAFVRLDDLHPGFAFGNIDRSIIMSPQKINARALLPITNLTEIQRGHHVDFFLYANNYEKISQNTPLFQRINNTNEAIKIFKKGTRIAKGTTTEEGLVNTYFANVFGPIQYKEIHDKLAKTFFQAFFDNNTIVAQLRTRLGIDGYETKGPQSAAEALLNVILAQFYPSAL